MNLRLSASIMLLAGTLLITACTAPVPVPSSVTPTPAATSVSSSVLLDKATSTVLDQLVQYPATSQAQVSSSIITLPPGVETGLHRHDAPMYAYVMDGELTVTYDGGIVKTYRPGQAIIEAVGTAHNGKNNGTTPVRILVVNMGAAGVANTVTLP